MREERSKKLGDRTRATAEMPDVPCSEVRERVMAETLADLYRRWVEEGRPDRRG